jgi:nitrate reductase NapE component
MPRGCDPGQTYLVNLGTTTQTVSTIGAMDGSALPIRNRSITSHRDTPVRKLPRKSASFFLPKNGELPDHTSAPESDPRETFRRKPSSKSFRAAVSGKGDVLPMSTPSPAGMSRVRTLSPSPPNMWNRRRGLSAASSDQQQLVNRSLRSRRSGSVQMEMDDLDKIHPRNSRQLSHSPDLNGSSRNRKSRRRDFSFTELLMSLKPILLLQVAVVFAVGFLVWDSNQKALLTTEKLHQYRHSESMLMLHLQRIEQQSIHLHENLIQLHDGSDIANSGSSKQKAPSSTVDSDLIRKQMQQLQQMEEELEHEVKSLQTKIKKSARNSIIHSYGEGPVQVVLEVDLGGDTKVYGDSKAARDEKDGFNRISILLWHDTPHAAWTWLEQIESSAWDNVLWEVDRGLSIEAAVSPLALPEDGGKLQFVEKAQKAHEAWTVGFSNMEDGGSGIFINLKDNSHYHRHEVCVGKVLDGFSVLQRLVEVSRQKDGPPIKIKRATASHMTRRDTVGL